MARIEDIERRLQNWARSRLGSGSGQLGYASVKLSADTSREAYRTARIPTLDCEAGETEEAVMALESRLRATVEIVYLGTGTMSLKAAHLCCSVATIKARVWEAHRQLAAWFSERAAQARSERDRVEHLQAKARPG
jgi:hypothetical protein